MIFFNNVAAPLSAILIRKFGLIHVAVLGGDVFKISILKSKSNSFSMDTNESILL